MNVFDRAALLEGLQRLGLTHMQQVVEHRAEEAAAASSGYLEFLYQLVEEELAVRFERYVETHAAGKLPFPENPRSVRLRRPARRGQTRHHGSGLHGVH